MLMVKTKRLPPPAWAPRRMDPPGRGGPPDSAESPLSPGSRTQARVEAARVAVLLPQVLAVPAQLPGVPEVLHQGLHQARRRAEVVALVAVEVPTQAAGPPRVHWGQLRGEQATLEQLLPNQPQLPFAGGMVLIKSVPRVKDKYEVRKPQRSPRLQRKEAKYSTVYQQLLPCS